MFFIDHFQDHLEIVRFVEEMDGPQLGTDIPVMLPDIIREHDRFDRSLVFFLYEFQQAGAHLIFDNDVHQHDIRLHFGDDGGSLGITGGLEYDPDMFMIMKHTDHFFDDQFRVVYDQYDKPCIVHVDKLILQRKTVSGAWEIERTRNRK
jgi:hypothetical protein